MAAKDKLTLIFLLHSCRLVGDWTQTHASVLIETPYKSEGEDNENAVQSSRMLIQMAELLEQFLELV
jgi:hypothetical protein